MVMFFPSTQPSSLSPCRNASRKRSVAEGVLAPRKPIRWTDPDCCATAMNGASVRLKARTTASPISRMGHPSSRSRTRLSVTVRVMVDDCATGARHPDVVVLNTTIEIAAVLVLVEEGLDCVEEGLAALVEHGPIRSPGRLGG